VPKDDLDDLQNFTYSKTYFCFSCAAIEHDSLLAGDLFAMVLQLSRPIIELGNGHAIRYTKYRL